MKDQYVLDSIEHLDFHINRHAECQRISETILSGGYTPGPPLRLLLEKSKGLCRQMVIPRAVDALVLQCLSDSLNQAIQERAPTKKSFYEPKNHLFSKVQGQYGSQRAWLDFQKEILQFSEAKDYVVVTDIANYYDSIRYEHLRNTIAGLVATKESVLDMLIYVLSGLLWQPDYMPRTEVGLPQINLDAPRLLAHCFLFELDALLEARTPDFARYMDDIDIGVDSISEAKRILRDIDLSLQSRHVRLNSGKTQILTREEAALHFRIDDNIALDELVAKIEMKLANGSTAKKEATRLKAWLKKGLSGGAFNDGNGDKILRRIINICSKYRFKLRAVDVYRVLRLRPNCQTTALAYLAKFPLDKSRAGLIAEVSSSDRVVDEATAAEVANYLTMTLVKNRSHQSDIDAVIFELNQRGLMGFYGASLLASKYQSAKRLFELISKAAPLWRPNYQLGRHVGGMTPCFSRSTFAKEFKQLVQQSRNDGALETLSFHETLSSDPTKYHAARPVLKKPNDSVGTGITHAKLLCILSVLQNKSVPVAQRKSLIAGHQLVWKDAYYRHLAMRTAGIKFNDG